MGHSVLIPTKQVWLLNFEKLNESSLRSGRLISLLRLLFRRFYLYSYSLHWLKLTYRRCVVLFGPVYCGNGPFSVSNDDDDNILSLFSFYQDQRTFTASPHYLKPSADLLKSLNRPENVIVNLYYYEIYNPGNLLFI